MLSTTAEYALRALTVLAALPQGASMLGRDLARHTGIPARYLAKLLTTLNAAGIVAAARGSTGGYWLARAPESIRIQEVIALFDAPALRRTCMLWPGRMCSDEQPCSAHTSWKSVRAAYLQFLEQVTVADISERRPSPTRETNIPAGVQR